MIYRTAKYCMVKGAWILGVTKPMQVQHGQHDGRIILITSLSKYGKAVAAPRHRRAMQTENLIEEDIFTSIINKSLPKNFNSFSHSGDEYS